jgi:hypothetical protein
MAVERFSPADREHEQRVEAFFGSIPKRRRERVEARYAVLEGNRLRTMLKREACWEGQVLDELLLVSFEAERHGFALRWKRSWLRQPCGVGSEPRRAGIYDRTQRGGLAAQSPGRCGVLAAGIE